ncbi:MAG: DUF1211 domain-containing protein [Rhizobiaceae bacterium]|nr:DUF1211 domain-containing protein [Rhizobiaceae bacterium]
MLDQKTSAERLGAFSDAVIAVIITVMVLELKAPESPTFSALGPLWPTAVSYAVSYLFIAIIWINHHHLLRFVSNVTTRLIWVNFAHLFVVALVPFATSWIARTQLAAAPVAIYATIFVCVNMAYLVFEREVLAQTPTEQMSPGTRRIARLRSLTTLTIFAAAGLASIAAPLLGFGLICCALVFYLRPDVPVIAGHAAN